MKSHVYHKPLSLNGAIGIWTACALALAASPAQAGVSEVNGQSCPAGSSVVSYAQAQQNKTEYCKVLGKWSIVRIANGGSMDGSGYGCGIKASDSRNLGSILCADTQTPTPPPQVQYVKAKTCPGNYVGLSYADVAADKKRYCAMLGAQDVARLSQQASLSGSGGNCTLQQNDARELNSALCKRAENTAYVEVNDHNLGNAGCFNKPNGDPLFQIATIFAANIGFVNGKAALTTNPQTTDLLENNIGIVRNLQKRGIKVVLSILNNHQNAGWSCFADATSASAFAKEVAAAVARYQLDGIDIDDEYDACQAHYNDSLVKVSYALRQELGDKIISKALFADLSNFDPVYNNKRLGDLLTYGQEMSYSSGNCQNRLNSYVGKGVPKAKLGVGASTVLTSGASAKNLNACLSANQFNGGFMIFNLNKNSASYLQSIWPGVKVAPNCLK
ncbi:glycosyl hydrolase family 18 protein [Massilia sp. W12]|uniref:glycosyl hydrolase family 18 protein n=1 Tax=Massilia sp. W12 TaxID=3126507 RepID=UPI0030CC54CD